MSDILDGASANAPESKTTQELDQVGTQTLLALVQSKTNREAAAKLSIDESTLYLRINKYGLREKIAEFPKQALARLQLGSTRAADVLVEKLDSRSEALQAATEILDRVGLTGDAPKTLQQFNVNGEMSLEFTDKSD